jgi:hypothetical protein
MRKRSRQASGEVDLAGSENAPVRVRLAPDGAWRTYGPTSSLPVLCRRTLAIEHHVSSSPQGVGG